MKESKREKEREREREREWCEERGKSGDCLERERESVCVYIWRCVR